MSTPDETAETTPVPSVAPTYTVFRSTPHLPKVAYHLSGNPGMNGNVTLQTQPPVSSDDVPWFAASDNTYVAGEIVVSIALVLAVVAFARWIKVICVDPIGTVGDLRKRSWLFLSLVVLYSLQLYLPFLLDATHTSYDPFIFSSLYRETDEVQSSHGSLWNQDDVQTSVVVGFFAIYNFFAAVFAYQMTPLMGKEVNRTRTSKIVVLLVSVTFLVAAVAVERLQKQHELDQLVFILCLTSLMLVVTTTALSAQEFSLRVVFHWITLARLVVIVYAMFIEAGFFVVWSVSEVLLLTVQSMYPLSSTSRAYSLV